MFPSDYPDYKQPTPSNPLKSASQTSDGLKYFQEKIKEANKPNLSIHNKISLLNDLKVKILQTHNTDVLKEVSDSLAQLQSKACSVLSEQYEICKGMSEENIMQLYTSIPEYAMKEVMEAGKELITPEMDQLEKVQILLGLQKIFAEINSLIGTSHITQTLAKVPSEERADVITNAPRLFTRKNEQLG